MRHILRAGAAFLMTLPLIFSQTTSPVTITPTKVSAQLGQPLYCAIVPYMTTQIHLYCYTTKTTTWDRIIKNEVIDPSTPTVHWPDIVLCTAGTTTICSPASAPTTSMSWQFYQDSTGLVHWTVQWQGSGFKSGTFTNGAFQ